MRNPRPTITTLTGKQRRWLEAYLIHGNATRAAREAGYAHPGKAGPRLRKDRRILEAIETELAEHVMTRNEALARLSSQARAEYADYITAVTNPEDGEIYTFLDLPALIKAGKAHLIKSINPGKYGKIVEFYDAQTALIHVGKYYKLFTDKIEETGPIPDSIARILDDINGRYPADI